MKNMVNMLDGVIFYVHFFILQISQCNIMETSCTNLKNEFADLVNIRNDVLNLLENLKTKIEKIKEIYSGFIKNNSNTMFVFGLDALHFQGRILDIEYDDMMRMFYAINNRMYCEYYKMHSIINEYMTEILKDNKLFDSVNLQHNFPVYKDLEPTKQYDFEILKQIHEKIITLISTFNNFILFKEQELKTHKAKCSSGFNIDNFVNSFNYDIIMMRERETLYFSYMDYFHKLHTKYMKRFTTKVQLMYSQINNDIKFDNSIELNNHEHKRKFLKNMALENNLDQSLLKELKLSIQNKNDHNGGLSHVDSMDMSTWKSLDSYSIDNDSGEISPMKNSIFTPIQKTSKNDINST